MNFNPNWVERTALEPTWRFAFATSGVVREVPNSPVVVGLFCCPDPMVVAPWGLAYESVSRPPGKEAQEKPSEAQDHYTSDCG